MAPALDNSRWPAAGGPSPAADAGAGGSATWLTIDAPLFAQAEARGGATAIVEGERGWTYAEVARRSDAAAEALRAVGVGRGDRVAIFLDKTADAVFAFYAIWRAGGVAVPINESLTARQVGHILTHSGSRVLISDARKLARLGVPPRTDVTILTVPVGGSTDILRPNSTRTSAGQGDGAAPGVVPHAAAPAAILYTSGSTGLPKGILISHGNLLAGSRIVSRYLAIREDERILSVLPFSFDYGLNQLLTTIWCGATLVLHRSLLPSDICRALLQHGITALAGVPPLWLQLLQPHSPLTRLPVQPRLRYMTNSGGVFPAEALAQYRALWPETQIYLMYGLSEAFRSTYLPPEEIDRRPGSMGRAIPETEIHVLDEQGRPCEPGEAGELVHRGPTVALGYWDDPVATAAVFRPSPLPGSAPDERVVFSGDLVTCDEDGFLYFAGRRDLLIKSQGYRISPDEVEEILYASGLVAEAVVRGEPDPIAGQAVVAHVVPREAASFDQTDLLEYCQREMPRYMVPRSIHVHRAFPRTASGKLDRRSIGT